MKFVGSAAARSRTLPSVAVVTLASFAALITGGGPLVIYTQSLGMGLADQAQDAIAFCCARKDSDRHVVAFAKSPGIGIHQASFRVADPDEVGRGGRALVEKAGKGDGGVGRHTIGSNFFY